MPGTVFKTAVWCSASKVGSTPTSFRHKNQLRAPVPGTGLAVRACRQSACRVGRPSRRTGSRRLPSTCPWPVWKTCPSYRQSLPRRRPRMRLARSGALTRRCKRPVARISILRSAVLPTTAAARDYRGVAIPLTFIWPTLALSSPNFTGPTACRPRRAACRVCAFPPHSRFGRKISIFRPPTATYPRPEGGHPKQYDSFH